MLSLAVELVSIAKLASPGMLVALWSPVCLMGVFAVARGARRLRPGTLAGNSWADRLLLGLALLSVLTVLLASLAPSTKSDETYYHMLVPARILADGGLRFYRQPWEAAIVPQLLYQIGAAPLHALGVPDAANVTSFLFGTWLLLFAWRFVVAESGSATMAALCIAGLSAGLYSTVWHSSAGSHAFGDLASVLAITLFAVNGRVSDAGQRASNGIVISALAACAAASKISLWPLAIAVAALSYRQVTRGSDAAGNRNRIRLWMLAPWLALFGPVLAWTMAHSGSPFGPVLTGLFGSTVYASAEAQAMLAGERLWNQSQGSGLAALAAATSPLVWFGAVAVAFAASLPRAVRATLGVLLLGQGALVIALLPHDARFLGGLPHALFVVACASAGAGVVAFIARPLTLGAVLALSVPWCGVQLYYSRQFLPVVFGVESRAAYLQDNVAFAADFEQLDRRLPRHASLLVMGDVTRIPSIYAPRRVFFDVRDLPPDGDAFLFAVGDSWRWGLPSGITPGLPIYENPNAVAETFRTPGRAPVRRRLRVFGLIWHAAAAPQGSNPLP